ncbi:OmpA family protein [Nocardiopsis terrae]
MPQSPWSVAGETLIAAVVLIGPPLLASRLGWPLSEDVSWAWLWQYLRGGTLPAEVVLAVFVALLWAVWAAYLVIIVLDILALLRGLVPRIGLVRLVWVLATGGATAASTHTAAVAAHTDTAVEVPARSVLEGQENPAPEHQGQDQGGMIERTRNLSGFGFDSAYLTSGMRDSLEPTLGMIEDFNLADAPVVVTGHTDPVGDPGYNRGLSQWRAQAVADYLAEHLTEPVEFEVAGVGSAQPPADPGASYAEHRRVEIAYTLQPPSVEETGTEEKAEGEGKAAAETSEPLPEQVQLDVSTTSGNDGPSPLLVGAATGAAGVGVGYAAGRRHAHTRGTRPATKAPESGAAPGQREDSSTETDDGIDPPGGELVRGDLGGAENGIIDSDGYMLVGQTARVDTAQGVAFVGAHAADVLAAVVADHLPAPVVATRAVAEVLQEGRAFGDGLQVVPDLAQARIAVQTLLLSAARTRMEDDPQDLEASGQDGTPSLLVVCEATQWEADSARAPLTPPEAVVCVLGEKKPMPTLHCTNLDRPHLIGAQGRIDLTEPLRHRGPYLRSGEDAHQAEEKEEQGPFSEEAQTPHPLPPLVDDDSPTAPSAPDAPTVAVRVRMFSSDAEPELTFDGSHIQGLRSAARPLVAYLAAHPEGVEAEQIDAECFGELEPAKAYVQRRNAIHSLRKTLRTITDTPDAPVIINDKSGLYRLDEDLFDVDLWNFLRLAKTVRKNPEGVTDGQLREIIEIHQEKLLGECEAQWVESVRQYCAKEAVSACVGLAEKKQDATEKIEDIETAIAFDEYNEPLYQFIIKTHCEAGSPEKAHLAYRELKGRLEEIGETPSKKTRRMIQEYTLL